MTRPDHRSDWPWEHRHIYYGIRDDHRKALKKAVEDIKELYRQRNIEAVIDAISDAIDEVKAIENLIDDYASDRGSVPYWSFWVLEGRPSDEHKTDYVAGLAELIKANLLIIKDEFQGSLQWRRRNPFLIRDAISETLDATRKIKLVIDKRIKPPVEPRETVEPQSATTEHIERFLKDNDHRTSEGPF